jgi:hypothetical protein
MLITYIYIYIYSKIFINFMRSQSEIMKRINKYFLYTNYFTYYNINYEMKHKKKESMLKFLQPIKNSN